MNEEAYEGPDGMDAQGYTSAEHYNYNFCHHPKYQCNRPTKQKTSYRYIISCGKSSSSARRAKKPVFEVI
jgi:hypothetical protein